MEKTQSYIGILNGVVCCIDEYNGFDCKGSFWHHFSTEPVLFETGTELLMKLEKLFTELNFPRPATNERRFQEYRRIYHHEEKEKVMSDKEMLMHHGEAGTFIIRVQQKQNSSWQGRITWVDEDKTVYFRSVWEMVKLIDNALQKGEEEEKVSWE